jgi:class 3 adenylate cyclase
VLALRKRKNNSVTKYAYNSLEDYLQSHRLDVDGLLDDGWGSAFPVKGRVIDAVMLFADMTSFSSRSDHLSPVETLVFVNNFFAWISAEGLKGGHGIVDKYIGDEVMVIFSKDFGSEDPLAEAVNAGRWMVERDALGFHPHIGIAAGEVVVGYVGTPLKYNCSVYGRAVTLARRCCQIPNAKGTIILPSENWAGRKLEEVLTKRKLKQPDGTEIEYEAPWKSLAARNVTMKGGQELSITEIVHDTGGAITWHRPTAEQRAKDGFESLKIEGSYNPRRYSFEPLPEFFTKPSHPQGKETAR